MGKKLLLWIGALAVAVLVGWRLGPMVCALFWAAVIAYLLWPLCRWLSLRWPHNVAVGVVFGGFLLALVAVPLLAAPRVVQDVESLLKSIPPVLSQLDGMAAWVSRWLADNLSVSPETVSVSAVADQIVTWVQQHMMTMQSVSTLKDRLIWVLVTPFVAFYLLKDHDRVLKGIRYLIPDRYRADILFVARYSGALIQRYLRGQVLVSLIVGALTGLGLWLCGVGYALLLGCVTAVCNLIPFIGFILAAVPVVLITLPGGLNLVLKGVAVMLVIQQLESMVLSPRIVGDSLGIHPMAILLSILAGGALAGAAGFFLAIPLFIVAKGVLLSLQQRWLSQKRLTDDCIPRGT